MSLQISISNSIRGYRSVPGGVPVDPDAQAFITAAAITDPTQQAAINTLVVDLKGYSIWTKMKALYPFVGGTASQHKFNLKDPRDLDVAFRLVFNGGWTHSGTGATPNGTNAYANTYLAPSANLTNYNVSLSYYSRTNVSSTGVEIGSLNVSNYMHMHLRYTGDIWYALLQQSAADSVSNNSSTGFFTGNRTANNVKKHFKNGINLGTSTTTTTTSLSIEPIFLGALNSGSFPANYSTKQTAFASIGNGLTDTEAANFYTAVQAFQTTLGRSIGPQTVSDADAQAFVTNAGIVDQVEATAINNLVIGLKADSLWTKMKAIYPFVGGSATSNSYNLRNTAQYQLSFSGGGTWNSNGYTGGVNGYANTGLNPNTAFSTNDSFHMSIYSRTNSALDGADLGGVNASARTDLWLRAADGTCYNRVHLNGIATANTNSTGIYISTRNSSTSLKLFKNNSQLGSTYTGANGARLDVNMFLGAYALGNTPAYYTQRNYAFASIGDGLSDAESTNLNNRINTFNTTLSR
jgi:hypothetical protein